MLRVEMANAVRTGIAGALNEQTAELFLSAGLSVLQERASERTGRFVLGGLAGLIRKLAVFLMLGSIVYAVGGWQAIAGFGKFLMGK